MARNEDVGRLHVAVHEPRRVYRRQRLGERGAQRCEIAGAEVPVRGHRLRQAWARTELHGHPGRFVVRTGIEHGSGVHTGHRPRGGRFTAKPLPELRDGGEVPVDGLDRNRPSGRGPRQMHTAHAALTEQRDDPVPPDLHARSFLPAAHREGLGTRRRPAALCDAWQASYGCARRGITARTDAGGKARPSHRSPVGEDLQVVGGPLPPDHRKPSRPPPTVFGRLLPRHSTERSPRSPSSPDSGMRHQVARPRGRASAAFTPPSHPRLAGAPPALVCSRPRPAMGHACSSRSRQGRSGAARSGPSAHRTRHRHWRTRREHRRGRRHVNDPRLSARPFDTGMRRHSGTTPARRGRRRARELGHTGTRTLTGASFGTCRLWLPSGVSWRKGVVSDNSVNFSLPQDYWSHPHAVQRTARHHLIKFSSCTAREGHGWGRACPRQGSARAADAALDECGHRAHGRPGDIPGHIHDRRA